MKSYTIIAASDGMADSLLYAIVSEAAQRIAAAIDDGETPFDVDVIEGTFKNPLEGDNVQAWGRRYG